MRNTKSAASLMALGMLLAAGPATTRQADIVERAVVVRLPTGPLELWQGTDKERDAMGVYSIVDNAAGQYNSRAIFKEAAERMGRGAIPPADVRVSISNPETSLAAGEIQLKALVKPARDTEPKDAERLAETAAMVIRDRVVSGWAAYVREARESLPKLKQEAAEAAAKLAKAREQVATGETTLRQETGRIDLSAAGMQAAQDALELERQKIELDLAGLKARREGLQEAIAKQAAEAADARGEDAALKALTKAVEASKAQLDRLREMYKAGQASPTEVTQAELTVLQAEARQAERANSVGGSAEAMPQWNRALTDASIEQREKEARLTAATNRLKSLIEVAARRKELDSARAAEAQAAKQLAEAESRMRQATDWLERYGNAQLNIETKPGRPGARRAAE